MDPLRFQHECHSEIRRPPLGGGNGVWEFWSVLCGLGACDLGATQSPPFFPPHRPKNISPGGEGGIPPPGVPGLVTEYAGLIWNISCAWFMRSNFGMNFGTIWTFFGAQFGSREDTKVKI